MATIAEPKLIDLQTQTAPAPTWCRCTMWQEPGQDAEIAEPGQCECGTTGEHSHCRICGGVVDQVL